MATITTQTAEFITRVNQKFAVKAILEATQDYVADYELTAKAGRKYDKIMMNGRTVYMFIDRETGDMYKPASLNAPAKIVRYTGAQLDTAIEKADPYGSFLYIR